MYLEEYANTMKMKSYRYNKLASAFSIAFDNPSLRLRLLMALDKAHMEDRFTDHTIKKILKYFEEDE